MKVKLNIKKIETYTITHSTPEFTFDMDEFRNCTPAFIGKTPKEFMDYLTNDIENIKEFIEENNEIICHSTQNSLYLLDVEPQFTVIEDSREIYEDSWFTMETVKKEKEEVVSTTTKNVL